MPKNKKVKDSITITWDWKDQPDLKELEALGLYVYKDPICYGSDQYGFIISKKSLTRADFIKHLAKENGLTVEEVKQELVQIREWEEKIHGNQDKG